MKPGIRISFCLIAFCAVQSGFLQMAMAEEKPESRVYTLEESITEALEKNWSLKAAEEKRNQAMDVKKQARADFLPRIKSTYAYTRLDDVSNYESSYGGDIAVSSKDNFQWSNTVTQPVFAGFGLVSAYRLAKLGINQSELEIELNRLDLALAVKEAYFNILVMDKTVEVARKEVESLQSNVEVTRNFFKTGMVPVNDLLKAEMELANARQNLVQAQNQAVLARSAFNITLARPVEAPVAVRDILVYTPETAGFQETVDKAMKSRPEIRLMDVDIRKSDEQITQARRGYYPEISLVYDYIKEGDEASVSGSPYHDADRWEAMAVCSWTLWEWGRTYYAVMQKKSAQDELVNTRNAVADNILLDVKKAMLNLETAEKNIPTTEKAVRQGEENLRVNEEGFRAQMNTITDVLDAQSLLTQARVNYYKALYGHNLARANLMRAMGVY